MRHMLPPVLFMVLIPPMLALNFIQLDVLKHMHKTGIPYWEVGVAVIIGLFFLIVARLQFRDANTEIMTFNEPRNLVTTGIYRVSRNPMYLGFVLLLVGLALYVNIWQALVGPLVFFLFAQYWYIPEEEKAAEASFGEDYLAYKDEVRRWL